MDDRDDLWRLLVVLTARKAIDQVRRERRVTLCAPSTISLAEPDDDEAILEQIVGQEPTPELAAQIVEQYEKLLERLGRREAAADRGLEAGGFH